MHFPSRFDGIAEVFSDYDSSTEDISLDLFEKSEFPGKRKFEQSSQAVEAANKRVKRDPEASNRCSTSGKTQAVITHLRQLNAILNDTIRQNNDNYFALREQAEAGENKCLNLEKEIKALKMAMEKVKERAKALEKENLKQRVEKLRNMEQIEYYSGHYQTMLSNNLELHRRNENTAKQNLLTSIENEDLKSIIDQLQQENRKLKEEKEAYHHQVEGLHHHIVQIQENLTQAQDGAAKFELAFYQLDRDVAIEKVSMVIASNIIASQLDQCLKKNPQQGT